MAYFGLISFFCLSFGILLFISSQDKVEEGKRNKEILKNGHVSVKNEVEEFALMTFCKATVMKAACLSSWDVK